MNLDYVPQLRVMRELHDIPRGQFGDAAGRTLGFTPRGLSPWAGLALALHDARLLLGGAFGMRLFPAARFPYKKMGARCFRKATPGGRTFA
jgi:hypothetical protein